MIHPCRAYQVSDQMVCPCGKQWDVNDPEPPACADNGPGPGRREFLAYKKKRDEVKNTNEATTGR
jgi:hypothetical protein